MPACLVIAVPHMQWCHELGSQYLLAVSGAALLCQLSLWAVSLCGLISSVPRGWRHCRVHDSPATTWMALLVQPSWPSGQPEVPVHHQPL